MPYAIAEAMILGTIPIDEYVPELLDNAMFKSLMSAPQNSSELTEVIKRLSMFNPE